MSIRSKSLQNETVCRDGSLLRLMLVLTLALLSIQAQSSETTVIEGRIETADENSAEVWIGVFESPLSRTSVPISWTSVKTNQFRLKVPKLEEILLLVLQKNSVPLVKEVSLPLQESGVVLDLSQGETLMGTVLSEDEFPIPDAVLSFTCGVLPSIAVPEQAIPKWNSDSEGRFLISGLTVGECNVEVVARPDMELQTFDLQIRSRRAKEDLVLADLLFVSGKVVDHQGDLVSDALVNGDVYPQSGWFETTTNEDGTFLLGPFLRGTTVRLSAKHQVEGSTRTYDFVAGKHDILFRLSDLTQVIGTVVDARTGDPLEEFLLHARREHSGVKFPHKDTNGQISALVDTNSHSFAVEAPGYVNHWDEARLFSGIDYDLGTVELEPGKTLTGKIYDASNDQPIAGAELFQFIDPGEVLFGSEGLRIRYFVETVASKSDQDGTFEIGPLPYLEAELQVSAKGYSGLKILVRGDVETLDIPLYSWQPRNTRVRGVIQTNSGEPVKGMVQINYPGKGGAGRGTNEDGSFDRGVSPGAIEVYANTKFGKTNTVSLHLQEGESAEVILTVDRRGRLTGIIEGLHAREEVSLRILDVFGQLVRWGSWWKNGEFLVEGVPPGEHTVVATSTTSRELEQKFEIPDQDGEAYVELTFRGTSRLYGTVEGSDLKSREIHVFARPKQEGTTSGWGEMAADGAYEILGLEDGDYTVTLNRRGANSPVDDREQIAPSRNVVVQGDTRLDLFAGQSQQYRPADTNTYVVSGSVHPIDSAKDAQLVVSSAVMSMDRQAVTNDRGEFQFKGLPAGNYKLLIVAEGYVDHHESISVGPSIEGLKVALEPIPLGDLHMEGTVYPAVQAAGKSISIVRISDNARIKSVQIGENGKFSIDQLASGTYRLLLDVPEFEMIDKEVALDSSIDGLNISLVRRQR